VEAATPLELDGRFLVVGFPPGQKAAMESLSFPRNREFLESVLKEVGGRDLNLKLIVKGDLPEKSAATEEAAPRERKRDAQASFKDDELIREALEIFKGEIKQ
jgi:hypothetical protein